MSAPLPCDNHADRLALLLMTNLEEGSTATFCGECVISWASMMIAGLDAQAEPEPVLEEAAEEVADPEPAVPTPDASPKSEPAEEAEPEPEPERETPPAETAEAPSD